MILKKNYDVLIGKLSKCVKYIHFARGCVLLVHSSTRLGQAISPAIAVLKPWVMLVMRGELG